MWSRVIKLRIKMEKDVPTQGSCKTSALSEVLTKLASSRAVKFAKQTWRELRSNSQSAATFSTKRECPAVGYYIHLCVLYINLLKLHHHTILLIDGFHHRLIHCLYHTQGCSICQLSLFCGVKFILHTTNQFLLQLLVIAHG